MKKLLLSSIASSMLVSSLFAHNNCVVETKNACSILNENIKPIILKELNVVFKVASDKFVDPKLANSEINEYAQYLQTTNMYSTIEGHTSSDASAPYNKALSAKRAMRVKNELIVRGVNQDKLVSLGYGESKPTLTDTTDSFNRRIEAAAFHSVDGLKHYIKDAVAFIDANALKEK